MLMQMTVAENLMFERLPQARGIVDYREMNRRAAELLEEVGLDVAPTTPGLASRRGADAAYRNREDPGLRQQAPDPRRADVRPLPPGRSIVSSTF